MSIAQQEDKGCYENNRKPVLRRAVINGLRNVKIRRDVHNYSNNAGVPKQFLAQQEHGQYY
jgi:hypothetical protein